MNSRTFTLAAGGVALLAAVIGLVGGATTRGRARRETPTAYVGSTTCIGCRSANGERWRGSHHDLAMRVASDSTVAGDFNNRRFKYGAAGRFNADRPESRLNLGIVFAAEGRFTDAEHELRAALDIDPRFVPGLVNLADLYRASDRDADAERRFVRHDSAGALTYARRLAALQPADVELHRLVQRIASKNNN